MNRLYRQHLLHNADWVCRCNRTKLLFAHNHNCQSNRSNVMNQCLLDRMINTGTTPISGSNFSTKHHNGSSDQRQVTSVVSCLPSHGLMQVQIFTAILLRDVRTIPALHGDRDLLHQLLYNMTAGVTHVTGLQMGSLKQGSLKHHCCASILSAWLYTKYRGLQMAIRQTVLSFSHQACEHFPHHS